jgi:HEAT repeat protein
MAGGVVAPLWNLKASHSLAIVELRDEVARLRQMVTLTLLEQPSANERLEGVSYSTQLEAKDEKVLTALLQALGSDPNVNVRVAAVGALRRYADSTAVRKGLLQSLAKEDSPLVQMELIDLMVSLREKDSIPVLEQILHKADLNPTVRQQAERGLQQI